MGGITPELAGLVRDVAGPGLAATLAARLGPEFAAPAATSANTPAAHGRSASRAAGRVFTGLIIDPGDRPPALSPEEAARRADLTDDELRSLLDLDDPHVDARLFANPRLDDAERRRMLSGARRDGRSGRVGAPLLDLLWSTGLHRFTARLPLAIASGDPDVATAVVSRVALHTEAGRLRVITGVCRRYGAAEARRVLRAASFPAATADVIAKALGAPDGPAELRERLAAEEDPEHVYGSLRALTEDHDAHVRQLVTEGTVLPWAALLRGHAADPLGHALHVALARQPDCPTRLLLDLLAAGLPDARESAWLDAALAAGRLTPHDLLTHARPAAGSLALLLADTHHERRSRWPTPAPPPDVRGLFHARLGTDTDAWAVAVRLLPEFHGSITELLTTATAATHEKTA
ncbi:hypothetical protein LO772_04090 [Yinghuangia sp. ASG 101]|uniref:hypothetical protein n=1 Tax=Yinghuangia sp. ASG 101 TaxID=2896848 RepID=UPI001E2CD232|nr:hypothetical protein [Yinghuangia sp. ASG 101]UGQ12811.1 hypothetical protein LO772_04090 [Yinghuangia sp. ASG 101]